MNFLLSNNAEFSPYIPYLNNFIKVLGGILDNFNHQSPEHEESLIALRESERLSHEREQRANAIIAAMPDLIFQLDHETIVLDYFNNNKRLHYNPSDGLIGRNLAKSLSPKIGRLTQEKVSEALETEKIITYDYSLINRHNEKEEFEARMIKSGTNQVVCIIRNITNRKRAENIAIISQKLAGIGQLAAGMAHEIDHLLWFER